MSYHLFIFNLMKYSLRAVEPCGFADIFECVVSVTNVKETMLQLFELSIKEHYEFIF